MNNEKLEKLEKLKEKIKTPSFINTINNKIDKIKGNKTIYKDGN